MAWGLLHRAGGWSGEVPSALQQAALASRRFVADLQMLRDEERKGGESKRGLNMWSPEMISCPSLYFRAAPCVTAGTTAVAGRGPRQRAGRGTCPRRRRRRWSRGGRARAGRHCSRRARCPSGRSARRVRSSSASPGSHHGLGVPEQRREGAAPSGGCSEAQIAQAGSP